MKKKRQKNKQHIMWRYFLVIVAALTVSLVVVYRLFQTTVIKADAWNAKAIASFYNDSIIPAVPERGKIFADDGTVLSASTLTYSAKVDWRTCGERVKEDDFYKELPALCDSLAALLPGTKSAEEWQRLFTKEYKAARNTNGWIVRSGLTYMQRQRMARFPIFKKGSYTSGIVFEEIKRRSFPYGSIARRTIGDAIVKNVRVDANHNAVAFVGVNGLERSFDSLLYGRNGELHKKVSTKRTINWEEVPAINGCDITTTINVDIQDIVEQELKKMCLDAEPLWATAVVMDVATGDIKAIANLERVDTFDVSKGYKENRNHAFLRYETGSVMKVISMLVALEDSIVVDPNERITTGGLWSYSGGRAISDAHAYPDLSVTEVISRSSNIGIAKIVTSKYGSNPPTFGERLREIGFFDNFNTGVYGSQRPMMSFSGHLNSSRILLSRMSYGYGMSTPPIYTLAMYNAIANGGRFVRPRLVTKISREGMHDSIIKVGYVRERICSEANAKKLQEMMHAVVQDPHGTGKSLKNKIVDVAGKTGTAYVIAKGRYTGMKRYSFCGFFPYNSPRYSCIVVCERAKYGAAGNSGKVFLGIATRMYAHGMLGNGKNYEAVIDSIGRGRSGITYATADGTGNAQSFVDKQAASTLGHMRRPSDVQEGKIPDVVGLGLRDAINRLESAGLQVRYTGAGYVYKQSLPPGSKLIKGAEINLTLRN